MANLLNYHQKTEEKEFLDFPSLEDIQNSLDYKSSEDFNLEFVKPTDFEKTINRLSEFSIKKAEKLDGLRKKQLISEIRSLQDKPNISENSKKMIKDYIPIYKRLDQIIKQKYEYRKGLQMKNQLKKNEKFKINCTFKPQASSSCTRSPSEFIEHTYNWQSRKDRLNDLLSKKKEEEMNSNITLKPNILKKSSELSSKRSLTPVFERLYEVKNKVVEDFKTFKPKILPESIRLTEGKRDKIIFDRLYSLRKITLSPAEKKLIKQKSLVFLKDSTYKINSSESILNPKPIVDH
jgi:hypothetical protein